MSGQRASGSGTASAAHPTTPIPVAWRFRANRDGSQWHWQAGPDCPHEADAAGWIFEPLYGVAGVGGGERAAEPVAWEMDWPEYNETAMGCGLEDRCIINPYDAMAYGWDAAIERCAERIPDKLYTAPVNCTAFQDRVQPWLDECFGRQIAVDKVERNHRFLEEALELVQSCGCTTNEAHQLVDYVFGRPAGEIGQEVGGVMVTLAALCLANDRSMETDGETELARVWTKVEKIRAKQKAKPKHSPLPEHAAPIITPDERAAISVERLAEHLATEHDYENNMSEGYCWPLHERDEGYRGGGYVRLIPKDVQELRRGDARRILSFLGSSVASNERAAIRAAALRQGASLAYEISREAANCYDADPPDLWDTISNRLRALIDQKPEDV